MNLKKTHKMKEAKKKKTKEAKKAKKTEEITKIKPPKLKIAQRLLRIHQLQLNLQLNQ